MNAERGMSFRLNDNYTGQYPTQEDILTVTDVGIDRVFAFTPSGHKWWFTLDEIDWITQ